MRLPPGQAPPGNVVFAKKSLPNATVTAPPAAADLIPPVAIVSVRPLATLIAPSLTAVPPPNPAPSAVIGVPPACVDFTSMMWKNIGDTVMPLLGSESKAAVIANTDPAELGPYDSVKIQTDIIESAYSKCGTGTVASYTQKYVFVLVPS